MPVSLRLSAIAIIVVLARAASEYRSPRVAAQARNSRGYGRAQVPQCMGDVLSPVTHTIAVETVPPSEISTDSPLLEKV